MFYRGGRLLFWTNLIIPITIAHLLTIFKILGDSNYNGLHESEHLLLDIHRRAPFIFIKFFDGYGLRGAKDDLTSKEDFANSQLSFIACA